MLGIYKPYHILEPLRLYQYSSKQHGEFCNSSKERTRLQLDIPRIQTQKGQDQGWQAVMKVII